MTMDILALLFPREKKFYRMLEEQVRLVGDSVRDFSHLTNSYQKLTLQARKKLIHDISSKEKKDDVLYTSMVRALKSTFITPIDREDIHQLVATFDTIIDTVELLSLKIQVYGFKKMDPFVLQQVTVLSDSFALIEKLITSLRREKDVEKYCLQIRSFEQDGDKIYMKGLKEIFSDSLAPQMVMKLQDMYTSMEELIDKVHQASLIIENIAVKYS